MPDPRVEMQKTSFRVIVGVVMLILLVAPPTIMMFGGGPFRTTILNLRVGVAAAAVDTTAEPTPQPGARPNIETIGVPTSAWAKANPAREPSPAVQESTDRASVGRASPPASLGTTQAPSGFLGGLFGGGSDRSDKPADRPMPINLTAMIQEQLLILIAASLIWLAYFGPPRANAT